MHSLLSRNLQKGDHCNYERQVNGDGQPTPVLLPNCLMLIIPNLTPSDRDCLARPRLSPLELRLEEDLRGDVSSQGHMNKKYSRLIKLAP